MSRNDAIPLLILIGCILLSAFLMRLGVQALRSKEVNRVGRLEAWRKVMIAVVLGGCSMIGIVSQFV